jgi:hypothetical protein
LATLAGTLAGTVVELEPLPAGGGGFGGGLELPAQLETVLQSVVLQENIDA